MAVSFLFSHLFVMILMFLRWDFFFEPKKKTATSVSFNRNVIFVLLLPRFNWFCVFFSSRLVSDAKDKSEEKRNEKKTPNIEKWSSLFHLFEHNSFMTRFIVRIICLLMCCFGSVYILFAEKKRYWMVTKFAATTTRTTAASTATRKNGELNQKCFLRLLKFTLCLCVI